MATGVDRQLDTRGMLATSVDAWARFVKRALRSPLRVPAPAPPVLPPGW
jgi:hypothetical protein